MGAKFLEFLCILKASKCVLKMKTNTQNAKWLTSCWVEKKKLYYFQNDESNDPTEFHEHQSNFIPTWLCV